jgi:hypothetical protein
MYVFLNFLLLIFSLSTLDAQLLPISFFQKHDKMLLLKTAAPVVYNKNCSSVVTVQAFYAVPQVLASPLTITPTPVAGVTFYSDYNCTQVITSTDILSGNSDVSLYFKKTTTGSFTLQMTATGYKTVSQTASVTTNPYIWTGAGGSTSWSLGTNWSGGSAPTSTSLVLFDSTCAATCIAANTGAVDIAGLRLESDFTGTINQGAATFDVSGGQFVMLAGTINKNAGFSFRLYASSAYFGGGTFNVLGGTVFFQKDWIVKPAATVVFNSSALLSFKCNFSDSFCKQIQFEPGTVSYAKVKFDGYSSVFDFQGQTMSINGLFEVGDYAYRFYTNGSIYAYGDVTFITSGIRDYSNFTLYIKGNASGQTITGGTNVPKLVIDAGANNVTLDGVFNVREYTVTSVGTLTASNADFYFTCSFGDTRCAGLTVSINPGTATYKSLRLRGYATIYDLGGNTWNVSGDFTAGDFSSGANAYRKINNGTINVAGNIILTDTNLVSGSIVINVNGTGAQSITGGAGKNFPGHMTVNKTPGTTVTLASNFFQTGASANVTINSGNLNMSGYDMKVANILTIGTGTTLTRSGGTLTYSSIVNNGTLNP